MIEVQEVYFLSKIISNSLAWYLKKVNIWSKYINGLKPRILDFIVQKLSNIEYANQTMPSRTGAPDTGW